MITPEETFTYDFSIPYYFVLILEYNQSRFRHVPNELFYYNEREYYYKTFSSFNKTFEYLCFTLLNWDDYYDEFYLYIADSFNVFFLKHNNLELNYKTSNSDDFLLTKTSIDDLFLTKIDNNRRESLLKYARDDIIYYKYKNLYKKIFEVYDLKGYLNNDQNPHYI